MKGRIISRVAKFSIENIEIERRTLMLVIRKLRFSFDAFRIIKYIDSRRDAKTLR